MAAAGHGHQARLRRCPGAPAQFFLHEGRGRAAAICYASARTAVDEDMGEGEQGARQVGEV